MEFKVRIAGVDHRGEGQVINNKVWVHANGRTFVTDLPGSSRRGKAKGAAVSSDTIAAPMPGKVTKILLSEGASVIKGQAVLVMEAMKMEYTLKAETDGMIEKIHCQVGDQVMLGKVLTKIKTEA